MESDNVSYFFLLKSGIINVIYIWLNFLWIKSVPRLMAAGWRVPRNWNDLRFQLTVLSPHGPWVADRPQWCQCHPAFLPKWAWAQPSSTQIYNKPNIPKPRGPPVSNQPGDPLWGTQVVPPLASVHSVPSRYLCISTVIKEAPPHPENVFTLRMQQRDMVYRNRWTFAMCSRVDILPLNPKVLQGKTSPCQSCWVQLLTATEWISFVKLGPPIWAKISSPAFLQKPISFTLQFSEFEQDIVLAAWIWGITI